MEQIVYLVALQSNTDIIIRAAEIQAGLWTKKPETIIVSVYKSKFPANQQEIEFPNPQGSSSKTIAVPVIAMNPHSLDRTFLIQYPNGETEWTRGKIQSNVV